MAQDYNHPGFKKLLQKLQEESWQLELLISGFAIFGLFTAYPYLETEVQNAQNTEQIYKFVALLIAQLSCMILIFNLLLHVLLRALWIGALGLRYISGDIDYEELNYSNRFTRYLKKKVGSFDKYIAQLEDYCSIIFAVSFLLIFYVIAITMCIIAISLIANYLISNEELPSWLSKGVGVCLLLLILIGMLLTFIDFVTQGFLKKKKWLATIYFPFYWFFSFLTLSFLYRPIVYNFLDNKFGRRLSFFLAPLGFAALIALSFKFNPSNYFSAESSSSEFVANSSNYEDLLQESDQFIENVAIQSKVIIEPYLKVFLLYSQSIEDRIFKVNPGLEPEDDIRGLASDIRFSDFTIDGRKRDSLRREYLKTFRDIYLIKIDSVYYEADFVIGKSNRGDLGFETYIPTDSLVPGKHTLYVRRRSIRENDTLYYTLSTIPFWYFEDQKK
ncbi:MAG: hypothetical protein R3213_00570 [Flavobacteriaceae bacterium]|nr:hypothetical protein [Flavobacteriaceae bacterium]